MRTFIILVFLFTSRSLPADETHSGIHKRFSINIEISCGNSGHTSESVYRVRDFVNVQNDSALIKLAIADDLELKLLAIVALDNISKKRTIPLSTQEAKTISDFKRSKLAVAVCWTCTGHYRSTVRKLFKTLKNDARKTIDHGLGQRR